MLALADKDGCLDAVTFVELSTGNRTLFPSQMLKSMYSANGCAAGNTPEEAIVQAISEVVERHHHMRILDEHITLPDIPESVLERYPIAYNIITFLRNQGFRVLVRDASLGMGFAVVCLYIIDPKTGFPAETDLLSVTIISGNGTEADGLSTALFVMGQEKAVEFWKSGVYDFEMVLITEEGIFATPGVTVTAKEAVTRLEAET